jgi:hypothetical protein
MITNVRAWLQRKPQPARLKTDDGTEIAIGSGRAKWSVAERNIAELAPAEVKALDAGGRVLRILSFAEDGEANADQRGLQITNQHDRDIKIAEIISKVSDQSALRHEQAYAKAFEKMCFIVELVVRRLTAAENQNARLQRELEIVAAQRAEETGEDKDDVMEKMIQGILLKGLMEPKAAKPNGKAQKKENGDGA